MKEYRFFFHMVFAARGVLEWLEKIVTMIPKDL